MSELVYLIDSKNNNDSKNDLYYFDFNLDKWRKCYSINSYPYNLYKYEFEDSEETFITCPDSYRLTNNINNIPSNEEMYKEKEWRDAVVKDNEELDMYQKEEWHKMRVGWIKCDVIPDVLHLVPRKRNSENNNLCGYYYKETKKIAKSCTHNKVLSIEELNKEKEEEERIKEIREDRKKKISEIESRLKLFKIKNLKYYFYDTLPYYHTLKINNDNKLLEKELFIKEEFYENYITENTYKKAIASLAYNCEKNNYDGVSIKDEYEVIDSNVNFKDYDGFYNIEIHNATYATLKSVNVSIDADIINSSDEKKIFGFNDITENNPLFNTSYSILNIKTDGDKITFNGILLSILPRRILVSSQKHIPIHFISKNFILLHNTCFYTSEKISYDRLEETTNESYKLSVL